MSGRACPRPCDSTASAARPRKFPASENSFHTSATADPSRTTPPPTPTRYELARLWECADRAPAASSPRQRSRRSALPAVQDSVPECGYKDSPRALKAPFFMDSYPPAALHACSNCHPERSVLQRREGPAFAPWERQTACKCFPAPRFWDMGKARTYEVTVRNRAIQIHPRLKTAANEGVS